MKRLILKRSMAAAAVAAAVGLAAAAEPSVCASPAVQIVLFSAHAAPAVSAGAMEGRSVTKTPSPGGALNATSPKGIGRYVR